MRGAISITVRVSENRCEEVVIERASVVDVRYPPPPMDPMRYATVVTKHREYLVDAGVWSISRSIWPDAEKCRECGRTKT